MQGREKMSNRITTDQIASVFGEPANYIVKVDYGKTLAQMKYDGHYDWSNPDITPENFPINGTGVVEVPLELVHLNKVVSSNMVLVHLDANGMRAATVEELLAFGATYPEIQRKFPVVALGSPNLWPGCSCPLPYLTSGRFERELKLNWRWFGILSWYEDCRFLAVRKSA
ncbi:MAG: hypothetical protein V1848_02745 [Candidatus Magasanikbacteria bacterium]